MSLLLSSARPSVKPDISLFIYGEAAGVNEVAYALCRSFDIAVSHPHFARLADESGLLLYFPARMIEENFREETLKSVTRSLEQFNLSSQGFTTTAPVVDDVSKLSSSTYLFGGDRVADSSLLKVQATQKPEAQPA